MSNIQMITIDIPKRLAQPSSYVYLKLRTFFEQEGYMLNKKPNINTLSIDFHGSPITFHPVVEGEWIETVLQSKYKDWHYPYRNSYTVLKRYYQQLMAFVKKKTETQCAIVVEDEHELLDSESLDAFCMYIVSNFGGYIGRYSSVKLLSANLLKNIDVSYIKQSNLYKMNYTDFTLALLSEVDFRGSD